MLPSPLPDDPRKWEGWSLFNSPDFYERLGLTCETQPTNEQIEENTRQLLVWWQKKLPLKNQPSNPLAQMLRGGIDLAPRYLAEARAELLNPERRKQIDAAIQDRARVSALNEFRKFLDFALTDHLLTADAEANLEKLGRDMGLSGGDIAGTILVGLKRTHSVREAELPPAPPAAPAIPAPAPVPPPPPLPAPTMPTAAANGEAPRTRRVRASSPRADFERMLKLSGLDEESMTDERRDTFIDMAENLGLDPGEAEDIVDDYLEGITNGTFEPTVAATSPLAANRTPLISPAAAKAKAAGAARTPAIATHGRAGALPARNGQAPASAPAAAVVESPPLQTPNAPPNGEHFPDFTNSLGGEMLFIPSTSFVMGSDAPGAAASEQPTTRVTLSRYYLSRRPITNAEYERFDPAHKSRRGAWADDRHPVIYVSSLDAAKFCQWLSGKERRRYRLPSEAEWEWAAKGEKKPHLPLGRANRPGYPRQFRRRAHDVPLARSAGRRRLRRNLARGKLSRRGRSVRHRRHGGQRVGVVPGLL